MKKKKPLEGLRFCVTGKIPGTKNRAEVEKLITDHGGKTTQTVSPVTDYLIVGFQTAKNIKDGWSNNELLAIKYDTKILSYQDLLKMIDK